MDSLSLAYLHNNTDLALFLILGIVLVLSYVLLGKESYLPPSPFGLPLVGHVFFLTWKPHLKASQWAETLGDIIYLRLVNFSMVVISDAKIAREAYSDPALLGRPKFALVDVFAEGHLGMFGSEGEVWTQLRRFTMRQLRDLGFGKRKMQERCLEEVQELLATLKCQVGKSISLNREFSLAAVNALWSILTGTRFPHNDARMTALLNSQTSIFQTLSKSPLAIFFPDLAKLLPEWSGWKNWVKGINAFRQVMAEPVNNRSKDSSYPSCACQEPEDFVDAFLQKCRATNDPKSPFWGAKGDKHLKNIIGELFGAGAETIAQTLSFAILYLCTYPEVQRKLQEELDQVVGDRLITQDDRPRLPYCQAVYLETLRKSSITPFGIFHAALATTYLRGYRIPKGTWICVNQHFIHHNPKNWSDPEKFDPERFLQYAEDGSSSVVNHINALIAFSVGKRSCPGESVANDAVFLFLANIFKTFSISLDEELQAPSLEGSTGIFRMCDKFNVVLKWRTANALVD